MVINRLKTIRTLHLTLMGISLMWKSNYLQKIISSWLPWRHLQLEICFAPIRYYMYVFDYLLSSKLQYLSMDRFISSTLIAYSISKYLIIFFRWSNGITVSCIHTIYPKSMFARSSIMWSCMDLWKGCQLWNGQICKETG